MASSSKGLAVVVKTSKYSGGVDHYAILDGDGYVIHNMPGSGVKKESEDDFFSSSIDVNRDEELADAAVRAVEEGKLIVTNPIPQDADKVVARAKQLIGTPYNMLTFNCEHFARKCFEGTAYSTQVQKFALGAAALGFLTAAGVWFFGRRDNTA
jgi:cell wall-associated NlpC family hydrolase